MILCRVNGTCGVVNHWCWSLIIEGQWTLKTLFNIIEVENVPLLNEVVSSFPKTISTGLLKVLSEGLISHSLNTEYSHEGESVISSFKTFQVTYSTNASENDIVCSSTRSNLDWGGILISSFAFCASIWYIIKCSRIMHLSEITRGFQQRYDFEPQKQKSKFEPQKQQTMLPNSSLRSSRPCYRMHEFE